MSEPTKSGRGCIPLILILIIVAGLASALLGLGWLVYDENKPKPVNYLVCYQYFDGKVNGLGNATVNISGAWEENTFDQVKEHIRTNILKNVTQPVIIISLTKVE